MRRAARKRRHPMSRPGGKKQFPGGPPVLLIPLAGLLAVAVRFALLAVTACAAAPRHDPEPIELQQTTLDAFEVYVRLTDKRNDDELRTGTPYFWIDGLPEADRQEAYAQFRGGQVRIERRSEERRVGKECRDRRRPTTESKKQHTQLNSD